MKTKHSHTFTHTKEVKKNAILIYSSVNTNVFLKVTEYLGGLTELQLGTFIPASSFVYELLHSQQRRTSGFERDALTFEVLPRSRNTLSDQTKCQKFQFFPAKNFTSVCRKRYNFKKSSFFFLNYELCVKRCISCVHFYTLAVANAFCKWKVYVFQSGGRKNKTETKKQLYKYLSWRFIISSLRNNVLK